MKLINISLLYILENEREFVHHDFLFNKKTKGVCIYINKETAVVLKYIILLKTGAIVF